MKDKERTRVHIWYEDQICIMLNQRTPFSSLHQSITVSRIYAGATVRY